jgi:hypothetical protein
MVRQQDEAAHPGARVDDARATPSEERSTPSLGRFLRDIAAGGHAPDAAELAEERKALSIGKDPAGGYTPRARSPRNGLMHCARRWY